MDLPMKATKTEVAGSYELFRAESLNLLQVVAESQMLGFGDSLFSKSPNHATFGD
jgi:hypothetical protein